MVKKLIAVILSIALPASATAGPLVEAAEKAARELALEQQQTEARGRGRRFWTGIALLTGGGLLAGLSGFEIGDDESGPDDGEDADDSDDGEDSDGWGNGALLGGGIAAAAAGGLLLFTGGGTNVQVSASRGRIVVGRTVSF